MEEIITCWVQLGRIRRLSAGPKTPTPNIVRKLFLGSNHVLDHLILGLGQCLNHLSLGLVHLLKILKPSIFLLHLPTVQPSLLKEKKKKKNKGKDQSHQSCPRHEVTDWFILLNGADRTARVRRTADPKTLIIFSSDLLCVAATAQKLRAQPWLEAEEEEDPTATTAAT